MFNLLDLWHQSNYILCSLKYCEVMKLADMPSCLGGGVKR